LPVPYAVDFVDYLPPDLTRTWVGMSIREAPTGDGPFVEIEAKPYNPLGAYFTDKALLPTGWYQLVLLDADGAEQPFRPYPRWAPSLRDVAELCPEHTRRPIELGGGNLQTFTADTNPTATDVQGFIDAAVQDVEARAVPITTTHLAHRAARAATWHAVATVHAKVPLDTDDADSSARRAEREYLGLLTELGATTATGGGTGTTDIPLMPLRMA
jgi:hypothetical protein